MAGSVVGRWGAWLRAGVTAWMGEEAEVDEAVGCVEALPEADTGVWLGD